VIVVTAPANRGAVPLLFASRAFLRTTAFDESFATASREADDFDALTRALVEADFLAGMEDRSIERSIRIHKSSNLRASSFSFARFSHSNCGTRSASEEKNFPEKTPPR
jgi:hypothetical protein